MNGRLRYAAIAVALLLLLTLPWWVGNTYYINIASQILLFAVFALALNVLVGYGGLVSLGHAGLFAIAGYAAALLLQMGYGHLAAISAAIVVTLAASAIFAVLALRSTGIGFLMITLALGQIIWGIAYRWASLTGGDNGVNVTTRPAPFGLSLSNAPSFYFACLVVFVLALATMMLFVRSPFGASLRGTRDQARRMNALGYNVWLIRFVAIVFSGFWTGISGHSVHLLQPVHQPAGVGAHRLGRGAADGDLGRHRHAARADRGRGHRRRDEERGERLCRALEPGAGRHLHCHHHLHAGGAGARHRAAVPLGLAHHEDAHDWSAGAPGRDAKSRSAIMSALVVNQLCKAFGDAHSVASWRFACDRATCQ